MRKIFINLLFISLFSINAYAHNDMVKSMQIEERDAYMSISDESSSMSFMQLAETYADIIMNKNAESEQLEALGDIIKMWMDALAANYTKEEMFNEYGRITSTLSCMSIHLILRIAIKDKNIPAKFAHNNIYNSINNKFIPSFAKFKNDGWKTEFNFYVINMSAAVCKWYENKSHKLDYPNFKVWKDGDF